jgi:hypothetical protein
VSGAPPACENRDDGPSACPFPAAILPATLAILRSDAFATQELMMPVQLPKPKSEPRTSSPNRPPIWVTGSQKPPFDARAFGAYAMVIARDGAGPLFARLGQATDSLASEVGRGRWKVPVARLGKGERFVPSYQRVGLAVGVVGAAIRTAGLQIQPPKVASGPDPAIAAMWQRRMSNLDNSLRAPEREAAWRQDPELRALRDGAPLRPTRPVRPQTTLADATRSDGNLALAEAPATAPVLTQPPEPALPELHLVPETPPPAPMTEDSDPGTLAAIRSMMSDAADTAAAAPLSQADDLPPPLAEVRKAARAPAVPPGPKPVPVWRRQVNRLAWTASTHALTWTGIGLALPYGATKALIAHLEGRDLKELLAEE